MDVAMPSSTFEAWSAALDDLERELDWAEQADRDVWTPPVGLGTLPAELVERATRILAAQRAAIARVDDERRDTGRHLAALRTVPSTTDAAASVYLDVAG